MEITGSGAFREQAAREAARQGTGFKTRTCKMPGAGA